MKPCVGLMGMALVSKDWRGRTRAKAKKAKALLPLCMFCHLRWVAKVQNLTCSVECAKAYRRRCKTRRHETPTYPKERIL